MTGKEKRKFYKDIRLSARRLYRSSGGIMFFFLGILALMRHFIFYPIGQNLWQLSLLTLPEHYISNQNFLSLFKAPLVPLVGLALVIGMGLLVLWEIAGLLLILEYHYQNKEIRLWKLFPLSVRKVLHAAKPKNWLILLYALVMTPLTDLFSVSNILGKLTIPEYIAEFINTTLWVGIPYMAVYLFCIWLVLHWIFAYEGFILEGCSFSQACKRSRQLVRGRLIRTFRQVGACELRNVIICMIPPALIICALYMVSFFPVLTGMVANDAARVLIIQRIGIPTLMRICEIILKMKVLTYIFSMFHAYRKNIGIDETIKLPGWGIKTKGWIFRLRFISGAVYTVCTIAIVAAYLVLNAGISYFPGIAALFIDETSVVAHKGYSVKAPENTLSAFEAAIDCGDADMIEFDVRCSKDGVPVVIHDASILKASGISADVYDLTLDELKTYSANYQFTDGSFNETIPTLEEVLQECSGRIGLLVEIKASDRSPDLPEQIIELLKKYDCLDQAVIQSGSYQALCQVKEVCPDIPCGLIMAIGIGNYYDMPNVDFFSVEHTFVNSSIVEAVHDRRKQLYVWTVNEKESLEKMRFLGADAIITDKPEDVSAELKESNPGLRALLENAAPTVGGDVDVSDGD